jgi:hypothetical protein
MEPALTMGKKMLSVEQEYGLALETQETKQ